MIKSQVVLVKVGIVLGSGFIVATAFERFNDLEVSPKNKTKKIGKEKRKELPYIMNLSA